MKRLMILGTVWALAVARPELYKEKEDFQYSRSSSDDGTKSGFYGAQRGNMGGNFERAHNMDSLAQNQMSGLVRQVDGELGDGAKQRTGSVYSAANSRGTYGSGHFDLSNLSGRNFQESASYGDSQSQASRSAASAYNAGAYVNSQSQSSRHSGYQAAGQSGLNFQSDDLQALDQTQAAGQYDYGRQTSHAAGYNAQSGFQQHAAYDTSNTKLHSGYGSNVHTRLISATPVRIIVRPGTRVAIPIAAQTYDLTQGSSLIDQNSLTSDAEVLSDDNQRTVYRPNNAKHYESSYNYRKEWEKQDTIPSTVISPTSTDNPFPRNSELYEDGQARTASDQYDTHRVDSQRAHSAYGRYNANVKSTSGQSRFNYDTQGNGASHTNTNAYSVAGYGTNHQESSSDSGLNAYNIESQHTAGRHHGVAADVLTQAAVHNTGFNAATDLNGQVENLNAKPKSYQSAYSYHKSWERQGDPYVIKPASSAYYDGQSSQRLTTGSTQNLGYLATGSHYQHSHASGADCDENGHIRMARSYNTDQFQDTQQQSQNLEDLGQQQQSQNLEDFGQQQQNQNLEDFGQQQQSQNLEDFGQQQQSQNLEDFGQQQQSQNLEDFGQQQQSQNLEDFGQQQQSQNLEYFGQQQQNQNLDYFSQQQQSQKLDDLGQPQHKQNLEDLGQQVADSQQEAGQQASNTWDKFEDLGQKPQDIDKQLSNFKQNNQNDLGQRAQDTETELKYNHHDQQAHDKWDFNYKSQDDQEYANTQDKDHEQSNKFNQQETQPQLSDDDIFNYSQQSQKHNNDQMSVWDKFDFGSVQKVHQNKYNSEHTNSNGNQVIFFTQETGLGQQPINSVSNPDMSQSVHHNVNNGSTAEQVTSNAQQSIDTIEQSNNGYFNLQDGHSYMPANQNQFWNKENSFHETHKLHQSSNWHFSNSHRQEQTNTDSYSHVNAFDSISPNTAPLSGLWNKLGNFEQTLLTSNVDKGEGNAFSQVQTNTENSYGNSMHAYHNMESTTQEHVHSQMKPYHDLIHIIEKDLNQVNKSNDTKTEKESSLDLGRGDISPEDLSDLKPDKYPSDTPVSSETLQNQDENNVTKNNTIAHYNGDVHHHENTHGLNHFKEHHDFHEQKDEENREQQDLHVISLHENIEPLIQQDSEKQHNLEQHNVKDNEESSEQQNRKDFAQQENDEQINLQEFGKQDNLEQQNLHDFGQQENVEQQNLQEFGQQENLEQHSLYDFGKQDNLEQQNIHTFGHQVNVEQQNLQDFGGKQANLEQQSSQDLGQQVNLEQHNLQDFEKQDNLQQQNIHDFGQQENLEQQNLYNFGKQDNMEQQNLQDFGQQAYLEQQNSQGFQKQDNLEQQHLHDFGYHVNVEQQNLQDFGKQDNLEQPRSQDFGQQVNLEQHNLQDFEKQDNLQQQNIQDFGQQENLEQQNLQDFGQQVNLEQHNLQYFGSKDHLQQQNKLLEQLSQNSEQPHKYVKEERTALPNNNVQSQNYPPPPAEIEQPIVKKQNNDLHSISAQSPSTEVSPIEPVTESTGFWKSIGNKFSSAKSKIASWF